MANTSRLSKPARKAQRPPRKVAAKRALKGQASGLYFKVRDVDQPIKIKHLLRSLKEGSAQTASEAAKAKIAFRREVMRLGAKRLNRIRAALALIDQEMPALEVLVKQVGESATPKAIADAEVVRGEGLGTVLSPEEAASRNSKAFPAATLESWAGHVLGPQELQNQLGIPRSTLQDWRRDGQVIGLLSGIRKHVFPTAQFVDARPTKGLADVLKIIRDERSAWLWLVEENEGNVPTYLQRLKDGDIEGVLEDARDVFA